MRRLALTCLLFLFIRQFLNAQINNTPLLKEIESSLTNKSANVSGILSDHRYIPLHPETAFRDLIKKYCTSDPVKITSDAEPGKKIKVLSWLQDENGKGVPGVVVYFYQTDAKGWYAADQPHVGGNSGDQRHARIFGYEKTDANGKFEIHTVKPSGYPQSDLPAHIHVEIHHAEGYRPVITEFLFDDDDRLVGNIRTGAQRHQFLIAKPEKTNLPFQQQFSYVIKLEKN